MHYFKIERARERGREGEASNATKFKNFACTAARNPQTHDPSGVSGASRSPPRAVPPGKAARVRNGRGLGHVRVAKPAQRRASLPRSLGMQRAHGSEGGKRCKANFATLCLLSHNWHSRHAGVHSLLPSLASNRAASRPQLTQFNFQRTAREGRLVDWSTFQPELKLRAGQNLYRSPSDSENDQRVQGWLEIPSTNALRIDTIGHAIKLLGSLANASFLPSIG